MESRNLRRGRKGELLEKTRRLLKNAFREYYFKHTKKIEIPSKIEQREFGYMPFGGGMIRHLSMRTEGELRAMLVKEAPYGVYVSSSYYENPSLPMVEKGWKGSDLIFDIDADDLSMTCKAEHDWWLCKTCEALQLGLRPQKCPSCSNTKIQTINWVCEKCLGGAKNEAIKLYDLMIRDFGITEDEITIYFSGNKGYHMIVQNETFLEIDQRARNEIADYVSGKGLELETLGFSHMANINEMIQRSPAIDEPGWRGRFAEFIDGYGDQKITDVKKKAAIIFGKTKPDDFEKLIANMIRTFGSKIDPSVTTDIHRIFRMPGSLHGESGLSKKRCDNIFSFNPMIDAVEIGNEETPVFVKFCSKFSLAGTTYGPYIERRVSLPLYVAVYLMSKDLAEVSQ